MPTTTFKIAPQSDGTFTVEMTTARGNPRMFPAFGSESEARAWIVQTERLSGSGKSTPPAAARFEA